MPDLHVPAQVILPGAGSLQEAISRRDRELARSVNRVADTFATDSYNFPTTREVGWRDLIGNIETRGQAGANVPLYKAVTGTNFMAYEFSPTVMVQCQVNFHLDHDIYTGTDSRIYLHTHWVNPAATPNTGNVRWGFEYSLAKGHQQMAFPAATTVYVTQACSATRYMHHIAEIAANDAIATNIETDAVLMVRIFRDAADGADTCTDPAFLLLADCHYMANRFSTRLKAPPFI